MTRNAIAVIDIATTDPIKREMYDLSFKSISAYADRIGNVTLVKITEPKYSLAFPKVPHLEKLQAIEMLDYYERVLFLDLDILINPAAPNIFEAYPENVTHGYDEGYLPWVAADVELFEKRFGVTFPEGEGDWKRLLNGGVMLWAGYTARKIPLAFEPETFYASFDGTAGEQTWVNTMMVGFDMPIGYLDRKWNWCPYADATFYPNRLDAYFLHYASDGEWIGQQSKHLQIKDDARAWGII